MKNLLLVLMAVLTACVNVARADEYSEYLEALGKEFAVTKQEGAVQVTAKPRLLEELFAEAIQTAQMKEETRRAAVEAWKPRQKELQSEGYVFEVDFLLLNQNLDAGIEIEFHGDWRNDITLENNKGTVTRLYKVAGETTPKLDFMYPERTVQFYFNTCDAEQKPLIGPGVQAVKLRIGKFCEELPELEFSWSLPLWYGDVARPPALSSWYGGRHLRTVWPYKEQVYHEPPHAPSRLKRARAGAEEAEEQVAPVTTNSPPPKGWPAKPAK